MSVALHPGSLYKMSPEPSSAAESRATYITENCEPLSDLKYAMSGSPDLTVTEALDVKVQHAHNFQYRMWVSVPDCGATH